MSKSQAVLTIYLTTATCGLGALLLSQVNRTGAWIILIQVGCVLTLIGVLETTIVSQMSTAAWKAACAAGLHVPR